MVLLLASLPVAFLAACGGGSSSASPDTGPVDADGDGYEAAVDCDDDDPDVHPGAVEVCGDGVVNDCDADTAPDDCGAVGSLGDADLRLVGQAAGDRAYVVASAGDVDGDERADVLVGAPGVSSSAGAVYLWKGGGALDGASGTLGLGQADVTLQGPGAPAGLARAAAAGDVDGDHLSDFLVSAPYDTGCGAVYLWLGGGSLVDTSGTVGVGSADLTVEGGCTTVRDGAAGLALDGDGDLDEDGLDDVVIGWEDDDQIPASAVLLGGGALAGGTSPLGLSDADLTIEGGWAHVAGDLDGDGLTDLVLAPEEGSTCIYLFRGGGALAGGGGSADVGSADLAIRCETSGDEATARRAGDTDGDGLDDLVAGVADADAGAGTFYLLRGGGALHEVSGSLEIVDADVRFLGEGAEDGAYAVAAAGDVDADGLGDVVVGAAGNDAGGDQAGAAYLLLGGGALHASSGTLTLGFADRKLVGEAPGDGAGSVSSAGDVDGDGADDLLVGAPGNDRGGTDAGAAYLILGGGL